MTYKLLNINPCHAQFDNKMSDLSVFRFFDLNKYRNIKTFHLSPGFEMNIKVTKGCDTEFVIIISHYPSLTYLAFTNNDAAELMMKLPGISAVEKEDPIVGEIFLENLTLSYALNDNRCLITLSRNGYELKRFMLTLDEYKSLKSYSYEITLMYERFQNTDCDECKWE